MSTPIILPLFCGIPITLPNNTTISVMDLPKNRIKKALLERVLLQQIPDTEVLTVCDRHGSPLLLKSEALVQFGLDLTNALVIPDVIANTLSRYKITRRCDAIF